MGIQNSDLSVLVVDDHMMMRTMISQHLRDLGFNSIETANTGVEALEKMEAAWSAKKPFNIVLLDWHMPDIEGIEVLEECREDKKYDSTAMHRHHSIGVFVSPRMTVITIPTGKTDRYRPTANSSSHSKSLLDILF